jgi:hypothetical protein
VKNSPSKPTANNVTTRPLQVTFRAIDILEKHEVPYCLVGSLATSAVGIPRATIDADLIAKFTPNNLTKAVESFGASGFYVSLHAAEDALRRKGMFSIIDLATSFKVDIYILGPRPFDQEEFRRRVGRRISPESDRQLTMATPEDLLLSKMEWYELGNRVSDRQWRDLLGILKVQKSLDWEYLEKWAESLGLTELLEKAREGVPE